MPELDQAVVMKCYQCQCLFRGLTDKCEFCNSEDVFIFRAYSCKKCGYWDEEQYFFPGYQNEDIEPFLVGEVGECRCGSTDLERADDRAIGGGAA